jgi:fermentation-respiration switch protein FrsA (DUF1100 family)
MRRDVEFDAEGTVLRGWFYTPAGSARPAPTIVMTMGFGGVKELFLDRYAEVFAGAGLAVLVYDHRNFGASDGSPRQEADPWAQIRDYRHAITFAQTQKGVDPERIGIWGTSYSGGHVLVVAAIDRRVRCVVSQAMTISGFQAALRRVSPEHVPALRAKFDADRAARFRGEPATVVPLISVEPGGQATQESADSLEILRVQAFRNEVTLRSLEMAREYEPGFYVPRISPTPLLMIVAAEDQVTPPDLALEAFERALQPKRLLLLPGGHYAAYLQKFREASVAARDFFSEQLVRSS